MYFVVIASGRPDGNSKAVVDAIFNGGTGDSIVHAPADIAAFSYAAPLPDDRFIALIESFLDGGGDLVLASPVYWDGLSAQAKALIDRFGDLLIHRRDLGQRLHGRKLILLLTGSRPDAPPAIGEAIGSFCSHLAMQFVGCWYVHCPDTNLPEDLPDLAESLRTAIAASAAGAVSPRESTGG